MCLLNTTNTTGRTVVASIHQPNSHIFHLFDKVMLLSQGEQVGCLLCVEFVCFVVCFVVCVFCCVCFLLCVFCCVCFVLCVLLCVFCFVCFVVCVLLCVLVVCVEFV
jgi:hypothetical protein